MSSKHRRCSTGGYRSRNKKFHSRKSAGWGMNLYRNTREGKIAGVAAGMRNTG